MGLLALPFPARYGGPGRRLAHRGPGAGAAGPPGVGWPGRCSTRAVGFGGMSLLTYGTEAQRRRLIPQIITGKALFAPGP